MAHVWEKSYPSGVHWDCPLPPAVPLESLLETAPTRWPDRIAVDFYDRTLLIANYTTSRQEQQRACRRSGWRPACTWDCTCPTRRTS